MQTQQDVQMDLEPVRELTDVGLVEERAKTDQALQRASEEGGAGAELGAGLPVGDQELGLERAETDALLLREREKTDELAQDASGLLQDEQAAHARSKSAVAGRDQLLAFVSHELRSPLTAIALNAESLLEKSRPCLDPQATVTVEDIRAACTQMRRLVDDLLDLASMESGRLRVTLAPVDAGEVMRDAVAASAGLIQARTLSLVVEGSRAAQGARVDRVRLLQVFANLFANAVKFTRPGGTISVSVVGTGTVAQFCVSDTGCGIPPTDLPRVFDRFWQKGGNHRGGLGLGLYISKAIVEAHGGRIWATSEVGVGSYFYFTLPRLV